MTVANGIRVAFARGAVPAVYADATSRTEAEGKAVTGASAWEAEQDAILARYGVRG